MNLKDVAAEIIIRIAYFAIGVVAAQSIWYLVPRLYPEILTEEIATPSVLEPLLGTGTYVPIFVVTAMALGLAGGIISMLIGPALCESAKQSDVWVSTKNIGD